MLKKNPEITAVLFRDEFDDEEIFDTRKEDFRLAFTVEDYFTNENRLDERYVKWFVKHTTIIDGKSEAREIPAYRCSDTDYAQFHPIDESAEGLLNKLKLDPKRGLYCIDWNGAGIELQGNMHSDIS